MSFTISVTGIFHNTVAKVIAMTLVSMDSSHPLVHTHAGIMQ